jgi:RNase H-fold protein (predicted Holliday junction resolvase)
MILAVDPSSLSAGLAVFTEVRGLLSYAQVVAPKPGGPQNVAKAIEEIARNYDITELAIEEPMEFRSKKGRKVKVDNLLLLARAVGATVARINVRTCYYRPTEWKGQLPKRVTEKRIRAILSDNEMSKIKMPRGQKKRGDVFDAIGIGLFHIGRARKGMGRK